MAGTSPAMTICRVGAPRVNAGYLFRRFAFAAGFFAFAAGFPTLALIGRASAAFAAATIVSASSTRFAQ
jgi:hypothetical protein